jgi:hypothetical protein
LAERHEILLISPNFHVFSKPGVDIPHLLTLMEPLHAGDDADRRPELSTMAGTTLRTNMIRIRRPEDDRHGD